MRPLVLISGLAPGGAEQVTASFMIRLRRMGFGAPVCTVTSRHDGPLVDRLGEAGVERRDLGARRLADPRALARLLGLLRARDIDLVHAHGQDAGILAAAARKIGKVRLVITRHVLEEPVGNWRERARASLSLRAFRQADTAVAVSSVAASDLSRLAALPLERIRVLHNGIDVDRYADPDPAAAREELVQSLSLPADSRLVVLPAVLRQGKGHDLLLDALPELRRRVPRVHVLFAGAGPLEDELRRRAEVHGDRVCFLGHRTDMPALMAASDLVVLPSRSEALPTVLMEAAAAGRPVVATRVGGVPEVVEDGATGLLVPPGDPDGLAAAMGRLLQDAGMARDLGARARRRAAASFSLERQAERTLALWEEVMAGGGP
jgi:glycosyltransferase involved in cell wall biosynthesis